VENESGFIWGDGLIPETVQDSWQKEDEMDAALGRAILDWFADLFE
jgi:hypothetical protein